MRQFEQGLAVQLDRVTARLEFDAAGQPQLDAQRLSDPRWTRPFGGLYWQLDGWAGATPQPGLQHAPIDPQLAFAGEAGVAPWAFTLDDDGPGIADDRRQAVLARGRRLDESVPASGLGLAIVDVLAGLYGGRLQLADSPLGGLRAVLVLPARC